MNLMPSGKPIPFISEYCDRWCERCPFTSRCAVYACEAAIAMCGNVEEGLALALGAPRARALAPPGSNHESTVVVWQASRETLDDLNQDLAARKARVDATALSALAFDYILRTYQWLKPNQERIERGADPVLAEAVAVVSHDAIFIGAKLHRAQAGHDGLGGGRGHDHPTQNDWNGSAKIALLSLERSEASWRALAHASAGDEAAAILAARANELRRMVIEEFPDAMAFVRPGFDDPCAQGRGLPPPLPG